MSHPVHHRSLFRRLAEQPQRVWLRRAIFQVHLWAGLLLTLYVIVIGITGSLLVLRDELTPRPHPSLPTLDLRHCTPQQISHAISTAEQAYPQRIASLASCPTQAIPLLVIDLHKRAKSTPGPEALTVYLHPISGEVLGANDLNHTWLRWIEDLHLNLLMGRTGLLWNGIAASVLLLLVLTGIATWWPGIRRWRRSLTLNPRHNWRRLNWDLHSVLGFWTIFFTFTWAITGMYFAWPKLTTNAIDHVSHLTTARYPGAELARLSAESSKLSATHPATFDLVATITHAQQASPDGVLEGCYFGEGPHAIFTTYIARKRLGDYANTDFVYFDQRNGQLLYNWHRGKNVTAGDWLLWLSTPLHFGTSWGFAVKLLWSALGLVLPLLAITGCIMYWNRYLRRRLS